jgi:hypothetical protein
MSVIEKEVSPGNRVYLEVMGLYSDLKSAGQFVVKRAEIKQGECASLPVDFCADVEVKARRALADDLYAWLLWQRVLTDPSAFAILPLSIKETLGLAFDKSRLGQYGDYKSLYARRN